MNFGDNFKGEHLELSNCLAMGELLNKKSGGIFGLNFLRYIKVNTDNVIIKNCRYFSESIDLSKIVGSFGKDENDNTIVYDFNNTNKAFCSKNKYNWNENAADGSLNQILNGVNLNR